MFFDCPPPADPKVVVRRERIKTMVAGRPCEVLGDWHVSVDDIIIRAYDTHHEAYELAFSQATLNLMFRKGLIR